MTKTRLKSLYILTVMLFSILFTTQGFAQNAQYENADYQAIKDIWYAYCSAYNNNDPTTFIALHEKDAIKMPPQKPMFRIDQIAASLPSKWNIQNGYMYTSMSINCQEILIEGDYAWSMGIYEEVRIHKHESKSSTFNGKFLTVFHRQPDGKWKICRDCFNSKEPPSI